VRGASPAGGPIPQWVLSVYALTFGGLLLLEDGRPTCSGAGACS
jgi:hypothetical protein